MTEIKIIFLFSLLFNCSFSQNKDIESFLSKVSTFDIKVDTANKKFTVRKLDVTKYSMIVNGQEMIPESLQEDYSTDSALTYLIDLPKEKIIFKETDSLYEYYKVVKSDSVQFFRFASLSYPLDGKRPFDSIASDILRQIDKGVTWDKLGDHGTCHRPTSSVKTKGLSGWTRTTDTDELFLKIFAQHKVGDIFIFKSEKFKFGWVVYKTDNTQYCRRQQIIFAYSDKRKK